MASAAGRRHRLASLRLGGMSCRCGHAGHDSRKTGPPITIWAPSRFSTLRSALGRRCRPRLLQSHRTRSRRPSTPAMATAIDPEEQADAAPPEFPLEVDGKQGDVLPHIEVKYFACDDALSTSQALDRNPRARLRVAPAAWESSLCTIRRTLGIITWNPGSSSSLPFPRRNSGSNHVRPATRRQYPAPAVHLSRQNQQRPPTKSSFPNAESSAGVRKNGTRIALPGLSVNCQRYNRWKWAARFAVFVPLNNTVRLHVASTDSSVESDDEDRQRNRR